MKVDEEELALFSTGKSSCHFAGEEAEEREKSKKKKNKMGVKILRAKGNKNTRTIMLDHFNLP